MTFCAKLRHHEKANAQNWRRIRGLQFPLHPQQIAGWIVLIFMLVVSFVVLIPALGPALKPAVISVLGSLSFLHIVSHLTAVCLDPADAELRYTNPTSIVVPEFDRSKHAHVIENGRCHLCNIRASSPRTKHCRVCNKCVERFDHHCKWMNHCIGARNYVAFLVCVVSAVFACLTILCICLTELLLYNANAGWLDYVFNSSVLNLNYTASEYVSSSLPVRKKIFIGILIVQSILCLVVGSLLVHLCLFHVYISVLGVTTYEYIRNYRQLPLSNPSSNISASSTASCSKKSSTDLIPHPTLHSKSCCKSGDSPEAITPASTASAQSMVRKSPIENYCTVETIEAIYHKERIKATIQRKSCDNYHPYCKVRGTNRTNHSSSSSCLCFPRKSKETSASAEECRRNQVKPTTISSPTAEVDPRKFANTNRIYVTPRRSSSLNSLPALPQPPRRQIQSVSLKELNEILALAQRPQTSAVKRPHLNTARRQLRRKSNPQLKPTKTPSLSPIHESGLSNPSTPHLRDRIDKPKTIISPLIHSS